MNSILTVAGVIAILGSAVIGGVFFAFSSFIMKALARLPAAEGIAAMQAINIVVINPLFLGAFMGTALVSVGIVVLLLTGSTHAAPLLFHCGAVVYFGGTFLVTIFANVPLNERLAEVSVSDPEAIQLWAHYLDRWTMWNHVRTVAGIGAALLFTLGLR